jgi:hypothetical protein
MLALFNRGIKTVDLSFGSSLFRRYGVSSRLLGQTWDETIPISVSADGNCLSNAFFPQATHILCTRHLIENARENLCKNYTQPIASVILRYYIVICFIIVICPKDWNVGIVQPGHKNCRFKLWQQFVQEVW